MVGGSGRHAETGGREGGDRQAAECGIPGRQLSQRGVYEEEVGQDPEGAGLHEGEEAGEDLAQDDSQHRSCGEIRSV